uniref:Copper type II ascorbate-dependent monooxygenase C-terminal domain-containing protein n=1 Tax=Haptolina brevifila TaxID=156173 RepID=A0A7S2IJC8_9EUKA
MPGIQLVCFGPYFPPAGAQALRKMQPEVNMSIVHHMIMFGGRRRSSWPTSSTPAMGASGCNNGNIMYAWARTGQTTPLGLNFDDVQSSSAGFKVGPGTNYEWIVLQIHYQQLNPKPVPDRSGVILSFESNPPKRPLDVQLMASWRIRIPPAVKMDECVACKVTRPGTAVAWRNHAHRLARDIYSEHFDVNGQLIDGQLGFKSAMEAQIFRVMPQQHSFSAGDTLLLHCNYDATSVRDRTTYMGADERTHEMCNQYFMVTDGMDLACTTPALSPERSFTSTYDQSTSKMAARGLGQVTGLAHDPASSRIYAIHRASNNFFSKTTIPTAAIIAFSYKGAVLAEICSDTFIVPHGLSIDHHGALWATDVSMHMIFRINPNGEGTVESAARACAIELTLGTRGKPGKGATMFDKPTDVAVHPVTNEVYIADGYGNSRVAVFSYEGTYLREFGSAGKEEGHFHIPHSIEIDKRGLLYVADRENSRVQIFDADGTFRSSWLSRASTSVSRAPYGRHCSSISYHKDLDLFVLAEGDNVVIRTPSGCDISQSQSPIRWPHDALILPFAGKNKNGLASDADYAVYVAELDGKRLSMYRKGSTGVGGGSSPYGRQLAAEEGGAAELETKLMAARNGSTYKIR